MHFEDLEPSRKVLPPHGPWRPWRWLRRAPVTCAFVALNLAIFAITWLVGGADGAEEAFESFGASSEILFGEVWRLAGGGIVHLTWEHVLMTSVIVLPAGLILESLVGGVAMVELLVLSTFAGAGACAALEDSCGGAVLAINGIFGALIVHPHHRGQRSVASPRVWGPLLVLLWVERDFMPREIISTSGAIGSLLAGALHGLAWQTNGGSVCLRCARAARRLLSDLASRWRRLGPVSVAFVSLNLAIFGVTWWIGGQPAIDAASDRWGSSPRILGGEWWRLITAGLVHADYDHVLGNCTALLVFGAFLESVVGSRAVLNVLVMSILAGSVASLGFSSNGGIGASGAVYGVLGAALAHLLGRGRHHVLSARTWLPLGALLWLLLWRAFEPSEDVGVAAHVAGLFAGVLYGAALSPREPAGSRVGTRTPRLAIACAVSLAVVLGISMDPRWHADWHAAGACRAEYLGDREAAKRHHLFVEEHLQDAGRMAVSNAAMFRFVNGDSMQARTLLAGGGATLGRPEFRSALGTLLWSTPPADEGMASFELHWALDRQPGSPVALNALARFWVEARDEGWRAPRQAIGLARSAVLEDGEKTPEYMETLARAYFSSGNTREAVGWMRRILSMDLEDEERARYEGVLRDMERAA